MIILSSPLLGKLGTLYVKDMHDFHLKGYMRSDILFRLAILVSCNRYLMLYILSTLSVLFPFPWGAAFHARKCRCTVLWSSRLGYLLCWLGEIHCSGAQSFWYITFCVVFCLSMGMAGPCPVEFHYYTLRGLWTLCELYIYVLGNGLDMVCLGCPLVQGQLCRLRTSLCIV